MAVCSTDQRTLALPLTASHAHDRCHRNVQQGQRCTCSPVAAITHWRALHTKCPVPACRRPMADTCLHTCGASTSTPGVECAELYCAVGRNVDGSDFSAPAAAAQDLAFRADLATTQSTVSEQGASLMCCTDGTADVVCCLPRDPGLADYKGLGRSASGSET